MKKIILSMLTLSTIAFSSCGEKDVEMEKEVTEVDVEMEKEDNSADIKVCYADACAFAEKQITGSGQRLLASNVTKLEGSYLYYFMSAPLDMSNICISMISEHKLEMMAADCGDPYDKQEEWKNIQWYDDPCDTNFHVAESSVVTWSAQSYKDTIPEHVGTVAISAGSIAVENDAIVGGEFTFDMASILESGEPNDYTVMLQNHLMDTSFFFVADFATSSFTITNVTDGVLTGNLEVLGISKEISFPIETTISAESIAAKANFDLNMLQFNLPYLLEQDTLPAAEKMESTNPTVTFQLDISASKAAH